MPARSGSKGVSEKNIREIRGKPLIHYTIEAAIGSERLSSFLVSTDSEEYAEIARDAGASVPFLRPAELAQDDSPTIDAVKHAVTEFEAENDSRVDATVLLQPTTPLRTAEDIDSAIETFFDSSADSLITCYETVDTHPNYMYEDDTDRRVVALRDQAEVPDRRQEFKPVYLRNGAVYVSTREVLFDRGRVYTDNPAAYIMPKERSVNIDEPFDFKLAKLLIETND
ncbi:cytidylyltransferase domain-containing protein [Halovenus salina]|uniref:Cytidylyltransferase domain-containing protein n=1 Tax=Halovenus salina TaxID=1510225 RepID=A0ABD5W282_9EURY